MSSSKKVLEISLVGSLYGHNGHVTSLAVGKDSNGKPLLVSGGRDRKVIVWKLHLDAPQVVLDSEGKELEEKTVGKPFRSMIGHSHFVSCLALSNDSKYVVSGSWDKTLRLWDLNNFRTKALMTGHEKDVLCCTFSVDNRMIVSGSMDKSLRYWNINGDCKFVSKDFNGWVSSLTHVRQDKTTTLAVGSGDHQVRIYDNDNNFLKGIDTFDYGIVDTATDEEGEFLFCAEKNGMIKLNSLTSDVCEEKSKIDVNADLNAISFESKYYMAITSATSKGLIVHEVSKNTKLYESSVQTPCLSLAWDESRTYLFAGFADGGIRVYQYASPSE